MAELRSQITVTVDDRNAQQALDEILTKLERASSLAGDLGLAGGGATGGAAGGRGRGAAGGAAGGGGARTAGQEPFRDSSAAVSGNLTQRALAYMEPRLMQATSTVVSGASNAAFSIQLFGSAFTGLTKTLNAGLMDFAKSAGAAGEAVPGLAQLSAVLGMTGMSAALGTQVMGEAVNKRFASVMALANTERPLASAGVTGGLGFGDLARGTRLGFRAQESAGMLSQFSGAIGFRGGGRTALGAVDPFQLALSGISPQLAARLIGAGAPGMGAAGGIAGTAESTRDLIGVLTTQGLRGSKVDEALARISSATTQMAEQGLTLDLDNMREAVARLEFAGGGRIGQGPLSGMQAVRTATRLAQAGPQAAQSFGGQFGSLVQTALQAEAFQQAGDPVEAMQLMQEMAQDPIGVRDIVVRQLGPEAAALAFAGGGFAGAEGARALATDPMRRRVSRKTRGMAGEGAVPLSQMLAEQELENMRTVAADPTTNRAMLESMQKIERFLVRLSDSADDYLRAVEAMLRTLMND